MARPRWIRVMSWGLTLTVVGGLGTAVWFEMETSTLQSGLLARYARDLTWRVEPGPNPDIRFPGDGPYDQRLGYSRMPGFIERLTGTHYQVVAQARPTPQLRDLVDFGLFPPYREKTRTGLTILDRGGGALHQARFPERVYERFDQVPPLVAQTLLFIENRELLDPTHPARNPAVEWDRFALAVATIPLRAVGVDADRAGGSTLATQIEKYRHSPEGRTGSGTEKLRQMASASVRAYLGGADTTDVRHRIVVDYLNSTPLSAKTGLGEVNGIGDGLWAWFGTDFATANAILRSVPRDEDELAVQAVVYKQVLSLLLAQRRPSAYLLRDRGALNELADSHLRLLERSGVIPAALADAARHFPLRFREMPPTLPQPEFVAQKATNAIRTRLLGLLGLGSLYELDRLDLTVDTTLDRTSQELVTATLKRLNTPDGVRDLGLVGERLLNETADPSKVIYSVTVFERTPTANLVRVQVDTLDRPLDLNEGAKLDLGSTAKLRTLASYLEIVAKLHRRQAPLEAYEMEAVAADAQDRLSQWVTRTLAARKAATGSVMPLGELLDLAMARTFSASPDERFFTGGGLHSFGNFDDKDDSKILSVGEAFRHSTNLVFIRLMREVVNHWIAEGPARKDDLLDDPRHPARMTYLARFADQEGSQFLNRFWAEYKDLSPDQALDRLAGQVRRTPDRLTTVFRSVRPNATAAELRDFLARHLPTGAPDDRQLQDLYRQYDPAKFSLNDRGYIVRLHPLELWLVSYLQESPQPKRQEMLDRSAESRQESYSWLFQSRSTRAQNTRIGMVLEEEAFARIHEEWAKLGYPFGALIPSYATSIGSSADRPGALADLMGIILNDGVRLPTVRINGLHFAADTPFETRFSLDPGTAGDQVMTPEVARILRRHLADIVDNGTARRVRGAFDRPDGTPVPIGGKTGTGDHRFERFGPGGVVLESRVVNRTATFVFYVGERYFGVITAHVQGEEAANYRFTSALPSQLLKALAPALQPLFAQETQTAQSP
ncbi:MAG: hypothetical protein RLY86_3309 [Pseudomonadota bacterium]|jgi:membrane peptidoglycan carboxypeptidase